MIIKNVSANDGTWAGQLITAGGQYVIQAGEIRSWRSSDLVIQDISSGTLVVNDGISDMNAATGLRVLLGQITEVTKLPEPQPFANPSYRTKRSGIENLVSVNPGETVNIDFTITEERYVHGGKLMVNGTQFGDSFRAQVIDPNGVIPEAYRPALCENWPVVAEYIEKEWIDPSNIHEINTYPLNAKVTPGLVLRIIYTAANSGASPRQVAVNYYLTKKL